MDRIHFVLVVDDDPELREALASALRAPGFYIFTAGDAFEAARVLAERAIDTIIVDVRMPLMSGYEFARQAKLMRPYVRIIYMTGYPEEPLEVDPLAGVLMLKPFRPAQLIETLRRELDLDCPGSPARPETT
jgi:DNA-binding response OmpR family regulator